MAPAPGPQTGLPARLYDEFARYYAAERCEHAPENPRRVFNLAFKSVYPKYADRLSEEQFLGTVYAALGFGGADPPGLFNTFDPDEYHGERTLADHFVSFFAARLHFLVLNALERKPGRVPDAHRDQFRHRSERNRAEPSSHARTDARLDLLSDDMLGALDPLFRAVLHHKYWDGYSDRKVGEALGMEHKRVGRLHRRALDLLQRRYGVHEK